MMSTLLLSLVLRSIPREHERRVTRTSGYSNNAPPSSHWLILNGPNPTAVFDSSVQSEPLSGKLNDLVACGHYSAKVTAALRNYVASALRDDVAPTRGNHGSPVI